MSTARNLLQKWLILQEPTNCKFFQKKFHVIEDYLTEEAATQIQERLVVLFPEQDEEIIRELASDTLSKLHPFVMYTQGQYQAVSDSVFTINNKTFSSPEISKLLKQSEYVFPHIVSTGVEMENYTLIHQHPLHRQVIREICKQVLIYGQALLINKLINDHGIRQILPLYPGEPDWKVQEGIRIFEIFGSLPEEHDLTITRQGTPNVANTSYGLLVAN